jgi:hypothetical protein
LGIEHVEAEVIGAFHKGKTFSFTDPVTDTDRVYLWL